MRIESGRQTSVTSQGAAAHTIASSKNPLEVVWSWCAEQSIATNSDCVVCRCHPSGDAGPRWLCFLFVSLLPFGLI